MRGSLMRLATRDQHIAILTAHPENEDAASAYKELIKKPVSRQLVRYWRAIFIDNGGNMSKADTSLKEHRQFIKPQPDDDLGDTSFVPDMAHCILVIPDQHAPYQHPDTMAFLAAVDKAFQPDLVVNLGDELDFHALSFHDSDPNLDSAGTELEKGKVFMRELHDLFPQQLVCHSNHGSMTYRKAKAHGIPVQMLRRYRDVIFPDAGAPGWSWAAGWRIQTPLGVAMFKHQASGDVVGDAAHNQCNLIVGHEHGKFAVNYAASSAHLYYGMYCGCLIDKDAMAFAYGKHSKNKPIIGCGLILEGRPTLIPMLLNHDGRWTGKL